MPKGVCYNYQQAFICQLPHSKQNKHKEQKHTSPPLFPSPNRNTYMQDLCLRNVRTVLTVTKLEQIKMELGKIHFLIENQTPLDSFISSLVHSVKFSYILHGKTA